MLQGQTIAGILVAAGQSRRMGFDKLLVRVRGVEVVRLALEKLDAHPAIDCLVVVAGENMPQVRAIFEAYPPQKPLAIVKGGSTRTASVREGVRACPQAGLVAVHDAARPFVSQELITRTLEAALSTGAAAPAVPVKDTIKQQQDGFVAATPPRDSLRAVQTPQVFRREWLAQALAAIPEQKYESLTDDCMVMERAGRAVRLVPGEESNYKITTAEDLPKEGTGMQHPRIGHGYDVHAFADGRALVLGGETIPHPVGLQGHSDADVLLHAVSDALLGGAALGDIGRHFPDTDPAYRGADSAGLLAEVGALLRRSGWQVGNIDATLLCQSPRLAPYIPAMRLNIARVLGLSAEQVSVKATTEEGLGFTGRKEGIAAHCVALLFPC